MERRTRDHRDDALSGPPDATRPRSPWPRLLAFVAVVALAIVLIGVCVVSFASPPPRDLRVDVESMSESVPRFLPVIPFGADAGGATYGAWITFDGAQPAAYLARHPETTCRLEWDASDSGDGATRGAFIDPCGEARYAFNGRVLDGSATKDLDAFPVRVESGEIIVDIERLRLGECREDGTIACSLPGEAQVIDVPQNELPEGFAAE